MSCFPHRLRGSRPASLHEERVPPNSRERSNLEAVTPPGGKNDEGDETSKTRPADNVYKTVYTRFETRQEKKSRKRKEFVKRSPNGLKSAVRGHIPIVPTRPFRSRTGAPEKASVLITHSWRSSGTGRLSGRLTARDIGNRDGKGWCRRGESNPHGCCHPPDFESGASASSATPANGRKVSIYQRESAGEVPCRRSTGPQQSL